MLLKRISSFHIFIFVLASMQITSLSGQTTSDTLKTLFGSSKIQTMGLYVAPEAGFAQLAGGFTGMTGASAMLIFNQKLAFGLSGSRTARSYTPTSISADKALRLHTSQVGLKMEYSLAPHKMIHLSFPLTIGVGRGSVDSLTYTSLASDSLGHHGNHNNNGYGRNGNRNGGASFGFIQPGVQVDVNLSKYGKFFVGGSYRIATKVTNSTTAIQALTSSQLSGLSLVCGIKLGLFDVKVRKQATTL